MSSFAGLEMGKRALNAFRLGIQTAGHNVSNVMTEGYSRQKVSLATTNPYAVPGITTPSPGQIGTGVMVSEIIRIRDEFLDFQFRSELSKLGYWSTINQYYNTVETYFAEPAGTGIRATFDAFWSSLQDLQSNPESPAARQSVVDQANSLGTMLNTLVSGVDEYASIVNTEVKSYVDQVNTMLHEVASLNTQISAVQASGQNPNDLMDQRDLLLDKLSEMMDVDIQDPFKTGDVMGEFFLTLNGRTLVQGDKVREVVAHAFQWENQTYYDVQVRDNEFDIVEDCGVALAISTGPEGVHMLSVDRLANGEAWTVGGEDALCLNPNGSVKMDVEPAQSHTSEVFENGVVLGEGSPGEKYNIRLSVGGSSVTVTLTWNDTDQKWDMSNDLDTSVTGSSAGGELLGTELESYLNSVFSNASNPIGLTAAVTPAGTGSTLTIASADGTSPVTAVDDGNILGLPGTPVSMRVRPITTTEALGLSTSFRIQVGSQGTLVASKIFSNAGNPDLDPGDILGEGQAGESYTFRVAADDYEANITVKWNDATQKWDMTSDTGHSSSSAGTNLAAGELSGFLSSTLPSGGDHGFIVRTGGTPPSQFSIASADNHLISITDVEGDLAAHMGMVNTNPVVTIDVAAEDSLETIRNKINEKYQEAYGLTSPEQWVHASLEQDSDQTWYLVIASDVAGEAQRITLMGDENGDMQTLRRLGLVKETQIGVNAAGNPVYREVTAYSKVAEDASFTFDGVRYLSADNKFQEARRVPSGTNRNDYTASKLETVSQGTWLELKGVGHTTITVRHHVTGGTIKGLEDVRDGLIPDLKGELDEMAWSLINSFNAYQYSGYGIGDAIGMTGVAFFDPTGFRSGSSGVLKVSEAVVGNVSLIGAAMGKVDENDRAAYGLSAGSGSGTNAARLAGLQYAKLLDGASASFGEFYEALLSQVGSDAARADLMYTAQESLTNHIDEQRQSVMGVNVDEEMLDILMFNQAFNAMARYITTIDEMLDRIINGFGLVGR